MTRRHGGRRHGAGRRRRLCDRKAVSVTLDREALDKLHAWCEDTGLTRSAQLRAILRGVPAPQPRSKTNG